MRQTKESILASSKLWGPSVTSLPPSLKQPTCGQGAADLIPTE